MNNECLICGLYQHGKGEDVDYHEVYVQIGIYHRSQEEILDIMLNVARNLGCNVDEIYQDLLMPLNEDDMFESITEAQEQVFTMLMNTDMIHMFYEGTFFVYHPAKNDFNPFNQEFAHVMDSKTELEVDLVLFKLLNFKDQYVEEEHVRL
jgi:hypothetical protein